MSAREGFRRGCRCRAVAGQPPQAWRGGVTAPMLQPHLGHAATLALHTRRGVISETCSESVRKAVSGATARRERQGSRHTLSL